MTAQMSYFCFLVWPLQRKQWVLLCTCLVGALPEGGGSQKLIFSRYLIVVIVERDGIIQSRAARPRSIRCLHSVPRGRHTLHPLHPYKTQCEFFFLTVNRLLHGGRESETTPSTHARQATSALPEKTTPWTARRDRTETTPVPRRSTTATCALEGRSAGRVPSHPM